MTTCNAIVSTRVREFGFEWVTCRQSVGVHSFISSGGLRVGYCSRDGHEASVRRQFAEQADIPEPDWNMPSDPIHESHSQDPSEGPSASECPSCMAAFGDHAPDATYATEGVSS